MLNDGGDHFLISGNWDSHGVDLTTEPMTSSTACLRARKVPADSPMEHGVGEPCKAHQDRIYIQVKVKTATWQPSHIYLHNGRCQVKAQMYYQEAKGPNQKLMLSSQECLRMNRPHKTVKYDLDRNQTKPDRNVRNRKWPQSQLSLRVKWQAISKEPVKVMAWSP
jgi:hypothetical protein